MNPKNECARIRILYEDYQGDTLRASGAAGVEEHLAGCAECREWYEGQEAIGEALRAAAQSFVPPHQYFEGLYQRIAPRLERAERWERARTRIKSALGAFVFGETLPARLGRAAALCLAGLGVGLGVGAALFSGANGPVAALGVGAQALGGAGPERLLALYGMHDARDEMPLNPEARQISGADMAAARILQTSPVAAPSLDESIRINAYGAAAPRSQAPLAPSQPPVRNVSAGILTSQSQTAADPAADREQELKFLEARQAHLQGALDQAGRLYQETIGENAATAWACRAHLELGNLAESEGRFADAAAHYQTVLTFPDILLSEEERSLALERQRELLECAVDNYRPLRLMRQAVEAEGSAAIEPLLDLIRDYPEKLPARHAVTALTRLTLAPAAVGDSDWQRVMDAFRAEAKEHPHGTLTGPMRLAVVEILAVRQQDAKAARAECMKIVAEMQDQETVRLARQWLENLPVE